MYEQQKCYNQELYHWGLKRGEEKKGHKYSRRELIGTIKGKNKYRYYYGNLKNKLNDAVRKVQNTIKPTSKEDNIGFVVPISQTTLDKVRAPIFDKVYDTYLSVVKTTDAYEKGKAKTEKMMSDSKRPEDVENNKEHKYVARVKKADGTYQYFYDEKQLQKYYEQNGDEVEKKLMDKYGLKDKSMNPEQDVEEINERHETANFVEPYYTMNCYSASLAYDLRRRGFDVDAIPDSNGAKLDAVLDFYEGGRESVKSNGVPSDPLEFSKAMIEDMKSEGDGARGILMVYWLNGGGHAMAWEVVGDQVIVRDCQTTAQHYSALSNQSEYQKDVLDRQKSGNSSLVADDLYIEELMYCTNVSKKRNSVYWLRTDDKKINKKAVKYVRKN